MKVLFILFLSFTLLAGSVVHGQVTSFGGDEQVLAQGQPPLTREMVNQLIEMLEWALEGRFTPTQRDTFQRERVAEWQRGDRQSIDYVVGLLRIREQILTFPEEKRVQTRSSLQPKLLETLRQQPNDPTAQVLLAVYEAGHRTGKEETAPMQATGTPIVPSPTQGGASRVPAELVGKWGTGSMSTLNYVNQTTGSYAPPSGTQVMYTIYPDGRYEYAGLAQQSMYSCTTKLFSYKTGFVRVNGQALLFTPKASTLTSEDNCNKQYNYKKTGSMEQETFNWRVERDEAGLKVCLQNEKTNSCAYKRD